MSDEPVDRPDTLTYLHADHLGSVSLLTNATGPVQSIGTQEFDPWGKVRTDVPATVGGQTRLNYTGQKKDDTGLLYYHARMYDPVLGRFVSPDSIVPGASSGVGGAGGTVGQEQNSRLTVDFHESGFLTSAAGDNATTLQKGFWFQLSDQDRRQAREPWGPHNPQALNRYMYVLGNPVRYVDPSGHWHIFIVDGKPLLVLSRSDLRAIKDAADATAIIAGIVSAASWLLAELAAAGIITLPASIPFGVIAAASALVTALNIGLSWGIGKLLENNLTIGILCNGINCIPYILPTSDEIEKVLEDDSFSCLDGPGWGPGGCGDLGNGGGGGGGGGADRAPRIHLEIERQKLACSQLCFQFDTH